MSDMESKPDNASEETLQELHDALDWTEAHLKRITRLGRDGAHAIDLVVRLRLTITTLGLPASGVLTTPVTVEEDIARQEFTGSPDAFRELSA